MSLNAAIIEVDVHGLTADSAVRTVVKKVHDAGSGVYRVRVIHGYHGGTRIKEAIWDEFSYGRQPKVKRIQMGSNEGITELILREL